MDNNSVTINDIYDWAEKFLHDQCADLLSSPEELMYILMRCQRILRSFEKTGRPITPQFLKEIKILLREDMLSCKMRGFTNLAYDQCDIFLEECILRFVNINDKPFCEWEDEFT